MDRKNKFIIGRLCDFAKNERFGKAQFHYYAIVPIIVSNKSFLGQLQQTSSTELLSGRLIPANQ